MAVNKPISIVLKIVFIYFRVCVKTRVHLISLKTFKIHVNFSVTVNGVDYGLSLKTVIAYS